MASAAALLLGTGLGGCWMGRQPVAAPPPQLEAALTAPAVDLGELAADAPFQEAGEEMTRLLALSPEEALAVLERVEAVR